MLHGAPNQGPSIGALRLQCHHRPPAPPAPPDARVGLLYIVFSPPSAGDHSRDGRRRHRRALHYLEQARRSAGSSRAYNPRLPLALATNLLREPNATRLVTRFTLLCEMGTPSAGANLWTHRLRALASSPFELTLEVDSSVTVCSPQLHSLLLSEWARNRSDFAVNFEHVPLIRQRSASSFGPPPCALGDVLAHCFAMLIRRSAGAQELMRLWLAEMANARDDQQGLSRTLRRLQVRGYVLRGVPVRVFRLTESVGAFKPADKLMPGWRPVWPRYTRPIVGELLLLHSHQKQYVGAAFNSSVCALANAAQPHSRILVQSTPAASYAAPSTRESCALALSGALASDRASGGASQAMCRWLPAYGAAPSPRLHSTRLIEPLGEFWRWLESHRLTAPNTSAACAQSLTQRLLHRIKAQIG